VVTLVLVGLLGVYLTWRLLRPARKAGQAELAQLDPEQLTLLELYENECTHQLLEGAIAPSTYQRRMGELARAGAAAPDAR